MIACEPKYLHEPKAPLMLKRKEMELAMQSSYADGRWNVTLQAWIGTKGAATALIETIKVARDVLPDFLPEVTVESAKREEAK